MLGIIKKDIGKYALNALVVFLASLYWIFTRDTLDFRMILPLGSLAFIMITISTAITEYNEDRFHGYEFLHSLPIGSARIVAAKFAMPLLTAVILAGYILLIFPLFDASDMILRTGRTIVFAFVLLALLFSALVYIVITLFGFTSVVRYGGLLVTAGFVGLSLMAARYAARTSLLSDLDAIYLKAIDIIAGIHQPTFIAVGLAVYGMAFGLAVRAKYIGTK